MTDSFRLLTVAGAAQVRRWNFHARAFLIPVELSWRNASTSTNEERIPHVALGSYFSMSDTRAGDCEPGSD